MKKPIIAGFVISLIITCAVLSSVPINAEVFQDNPTRKIETEDGKVFSLPDDGAHRILSPSNGRTSTALTNNSTGMLNIYNSDENVLPTVKIPIATPRLITNADGSITIDTRTSSNP